MLFGPSLQFADTTSSSSGLGAFNVNWKAFVFQLITFVIVVLIFKRWLLPPILRTLEERRKTLEDSLEHAKETEETLAKAEARADEIIAKARANADAAIAEAKKAAAEVTAKGETAAAQRAALIIKEAEDRLGSEREKLRQELRSELADLVADATEKIIAEKLDAKSDMQLIERAIKELAR